MLLRSFLFLLLAGTLLAQDNPHRLIGASRTQIGVTTGYSGGYARIAYPNGDVPVSSGSCTDVLIRAFRKLGIDLQRDVHEDMAHDFAAYPRRWHMHGTDTNIDHRRVLNLMTYLRRKGKEVPISVRAQDYLPGDIVAWDLGAGATHIGIISDRTTVLLSYPLVVHNIGAGVKEEDILFRFRIIGHYRYFQ